MTMPAIDRPDRPTRRVGILTATLSLFYLTVAMSLLAQRDAILGKCIRAA
jgi:hypothetical protein